MTERLRYFAAVVLMSSVVNVGTAQFSFAIPDAIKLLKGSWRGSGTASPSKGARERISCRVKYDVRAMTVVQNVNCAGADYRINVKANLTVRGNTISGSWQETHFNYSGGLSGSVRGNVISARILGVSFSGRMNIKVSSRRQTVSITRYDAKSKKYRNMANITLRK